MDPRRLFSREGRGKYSRKTGNGQGMAALKKPFYLHLKTVPLYDFCASLILLSLPMKSRCQDTKSLTAYPLATKEQSRKNIVQFYLFLSIFDAP